MLIAITGTPGVGKTTTSHILRERGHFVLDINQMADEKDFVVGFDENRDSKIIDVERLDDFVQRHYTNDDYIFEGHLSHMLSVDVVIILRCDPLILKKRLSAKKWSDAKIKENVGAEILDVIKVEAYEMAENVYEVDTTNKTEEEVADAIEGVINGDYEEPHIDWLSRYEYLLF